MILHLNVFSLVRESMIFGQEYGTLAIRNHSHLAIYNSNLETIPFSNKVPLVVYATSTYLALVLERATTKCRDAFQLMGLPQAVNT